MKKNLFLPISLLFCLALPGTATLASPVNINQADAVEIASALQGIGQKKAEAIVEFRKLNGEFESVDQLTQVKGIGEKLVSTLRGDILLKQP